MYYHLSEKANLTTLVPKIPECAVSMYEDKTIKRVCFSDFIGGCLSALQDIPCKYYVYTPINDVKMYRPSVEEVRDVNFTHEVWCLEPIPVKCIGIIESFNYTKVERHNTGRGRTTFFHYPYRWIKIFE